MANKTTHIQVRVSPDEKAAIKKIASENKRSLSAYMVWMALNGEVTDNKIAKIEFNNDTYESL